MTEFLIGTGGWAYFHVPKVHPLVAYSKAFDFVEANSTFYEIPNLKRVESWHTTVPLGFKFSVRCNQIVTHKFKFEAVPETFEVLEKMVAICKILNSEILHFQTPPTFRPNKANAEIIMNFLSSAKLNSIRPALEVRSTDDMYPSFTKAIQDLNIIHTVDLLKGSFRGWCFGEVKFTDYLRMQLDLLDAKLLDWNFFYWSVNKGEATLRANSKRNRPKQELVSTLYSYPVPVPNKFNGVFYDTGVEKRGLTVFLGEKARVLRGDN